MAFDSEITTKSRDLIVLEDARERIARGWCQGALEDQNGAVCIVGAIEFANPDWTREADLLAILGLPDDASAGGALRYAAKWNDAPGRTQQEVLARFDAAIARLATLSTDA